MLGRLFVSKVIIEKFTMCLRELQCQYFGRSCIKYILISKQTIFSDCTKTILNWPLSNSPKRSLISFSLELGLKESKQDVTNVVSPRKHLEKCIQVLLYRFPANFKAFVMRRIKFILISFKKGQQLSIDLEVLLTPTVVTMSEESLLISAIPVEFCRTD